MLSISKENKDFELFKNELKLYLFENRVPINVNPCTYWKKIIKTIQNYQF